jgi:hypothetical protein
MRKEQCQMLKKLKVKEMLPAQWPKTEKDYLQ